MSIFPNIQHSRFQDQREDYGGYKEEFQGQDDLLKDFMDPDLEKIHTFDQSVGNMLCTEVKLIGHKIVYVINPLQKNKQLSLRQWDLWGPLLQIMTMASVLSMASNANSDYIFGVVFGVVVIGALMTNLNIKFLGADISFFQSLSVIGYCMFPITVAILVTITFKNFLPWGFKIFFAGFSFLHASLAATAFLNTIVPKDKKILAVYPCALFYFYLSSYIIIS